MSDKPIPPKIDSDDDFVQDRGSITPKEDEAGQKARMARFNRFSRLPAIVKSSLVKLWFAGAACYFIIWGGFKIGGDLLDAAAVMALAIGILTEFLTVPILDMVDGEKQDIHKYIMVGIKLKNVWLHYFLRLIINIIYAFAICVLIMFIYHWINLLAFSLGHDKNQMALSVEPILYGLFFVLIDLVALSIKNLVKKLLCKTLKN